MHDAGKVVPAIRDRPSVTGFEWLWQAFIDLGTCRHYGMSPGPIPWTAIEEYARVNELGVDDTWMLHRVIRRADDVWLAQKAEATKPAAQSAPAAPPKGIGRGRPKR